MKRICLTILSALLTFVARRFSFLSFLMWIALVPLFFAISDKKHTLRHAGLFGFLYYGLTIAWMFSIGKLSEFGLTGIVGFFFAFFCWFGLSLYGAAGYMVLFFFLKKKRKMLSPLWLACGFMLLEGVQGLSFSPFAFAWCSLAYSQSGAVMQSASLFGSVFITFLLVFFNASVCVSWSNKRVASLYAACILVCVNLLFGIYKLNKTYDGVSGTVSVVQNNIASNEKWKNKDVLSTLAAYAEQARGELIVFSETVFPAAMPASYAQRLGKAEQCVLIGALDKDENGKSRVAMHMIEKGEITTTSHKRHLVPFVEYMPPGFGFLSKYIGLLSFSAGKTAELHGKGEKTICSMVCYDSCFSFYAREGVKKGATLLTVSTNDSWFDGSTEPLQHMKISAYRAVEQGRYMVHASTTGITAIIDPCGRVRYALPPQKSGVLEGTVQYIQKRTVYSYIGEWLLVLCPAVMIIMKRREQYAI